MDRKRVIGEVAARHGVRLEEDDPAFLLVTIAEIALKEAQANFTAAVQQSIADHEAAAERMQLRLGETLAKLFHPVIANVVAQPAIREPRASKISTSSVMLGGLALFAAGVVLGRWCF